MGAFTSLSSACVEALASPRLAALDPSRAPVTVLGCGDRSLRVREPENDAIMEAMVASAHATALAAGDDEYDDVMEEICSGLITERPAYWAQVWPSAVALSRLLITQPSLVAKRRVLEVGSGLGLASASAAMAGAASVVATDREPDALAFAHSNAVENGVGHLVDTALLDWSVPEPMRALQVALARQELPLFDVVLCSDVLYDESAPALLARLLHECIVPGGACILTDNADRPYKDARRAALLQLLCDEGDFTPEAAAQSVVKLQSLQGDSFDIEERVLRRS